MAAPSRRLYIIVLVIFLLFIPTGLVINHYGPAMAEAWRWRHLGKPMGHKGKVVGYIIAGGHQEKCCELDLSGEVVREWATEHNCFVVDVLADGNLLLGTGRKVTEIERGGKVVWELPASAGLSQPVDVSRLENGNTLVVDLARGRVVEFSPKGKEVWSYKCKNPYSAQRLGNGNPLIGSLGSSRAGRGFEVTPAGEVGWEKTGRRGPHYARRLANGNTLVAYYYERKVVEVDRDGREVWSHECNGNRPGLDRLKSAERVPDGRTLVVIDESSRFGTRGEILLISPDGKEEVLYEGPAAGRACAVYEGR